MADLLKKHLIPFSVFLTGACVLVIEIVAVRVLSPHFGNTIYTVSSVISVILVALSIGYYAGGKFADTHPSLRWFFGIILVSGLLVVAIHFLGMILLPFLSISLSLTSGPLISSLLLFLVPAFLLGTLSPYAITLQSLQMPEQGIGHISGEMFFWSTLGSIIGSLLAGFVLIPNFGIDYIFIATGVVLFLLGLIPLIVLDFDKTRLVKSTVAIIFLVGITTYLVEAIEVAALHTEDGIYEKITIFDSTDNGRPVRIFQQDKSASGAMFLDTDDSSDMVYEYTKYYSLYKIFTPEIKNALVIGGGAYTIPKALLKEQPNATVDVSEIEPVLFPLAQEYFAVTDTPNLNNYTEDGRRFLRDTDKKYDLIFSDVYYSLFSIPAHFTTQEFFSVAKEKLSDDGVFIANLIGNVSRKQPSLIFSEIKTFQSVFPNSYFFAADSPTKLGVQNIIFVGYKSDKKIDFTNSLITENPDPIIRSLKDKQMNLGRYELSPYSVLTDDYAPVEHLTAEILHHADDAGVSLDGAEMLATIDQQLRYGPRYMGASGHKKVQDFLVTELETLTDEVAVQTFDYTATDGNVYELKNIIGRLYPERERRIILGTHYDSKKFADKDWMRSDNPVPGANDSASGVAALIELSRVLSLSETSPNVGIDFVFFDGEEGDVNQGSDYSSWKPLGSTYFAERLSEIYGENKPQSGIILDMVCDKNLKIYREPISMQNAQAEVDAFWTIARKQSPAVFKDEVGPAIVDDHAPLNAAGIPSFLLIDFTYAPFHTTKDILDKCSAESLETVAVTVLEYVRSIP